MENLLPKAQIEAHFDWPVLYEYLSLGQLLEIVARKPSSVFELGLTIWTHHLESHPAQDPREIAEFVDNDDPQLIDRIKEIIAGDVIHDIGYQIAVVQDDNLENQVVAELVISHVYPGYLHISDVEFSNVYRPISLAERRYPLQEYAGLGAFGPLMANLRRFAEEHQIEHISLVAADPTLRPYFGRHGFQVEDNPAGRYGVDQQLSIPMRLRV